MRAITCHIFFCRWGPVDDTGVLTVHFPVIYNVTDFVAQKYDTALTANFITSFTLQYTQDGVTWLDHVSSNGSAIEYPALSATVDENFMDFRDEIIALGLRIQVLTYATVPFLRLELLGYPYGKTSFS